MGRRLLSTWNQIAPRAYVKQWYCFPYQRDADLGLLGDSLAQSLDQLARHFPDLAGKIALVSDPKGRLCLDVDDDDDDAAIPLRILDQRGSFGWTYAQLKDQDFPAKAFVGSSFDLPHKLLEDQPGVPVLEVHARIIEDGLLLGIYTHHSISDGNGLDNHISSFAKLTRDATQTLEVQHPTDFHVDLPERLGGNSSLPNTTLGSLLDLFPEYHLLPSPTGPTQFRTQPNGTPIESIPLTGRIFTIESEQLSRLKNILPRSANHCPSTFTCLAVLTWAHVTRARLSSTNFLFSAANMSTSSAPPSVTSQGKTRLLISTDWRRRTLSGAMDRSAGNAIALPITELDTATILAAASLAPPAPARNTPGATAASITALEALDTAVGALEASVHTVDEDYVLRRTALIRTAPDPRLIGLAADSRDPREFYFNTWRHFGARARWGLPGLLGEEDGSEGGVAAEAIRRAQGGWNLGGGLILPARGSGDKYEVLVTLDAEAMEKLCADEVWMEWVDKVVE